MNRIFQFRCNDLDFYIQIGFISFKIRLIRIKICRSFSL
jgi:hypothetical protein